MLNLLSKAIDRGSYNVNVNCEFWGGSLDITTDIDNIRYDGKTIFVENALMDEAGFDFEIELDDTVKATETEFDDGFEIEISHKGITGLVNNQNIYITVMEG